MGWCALTLRSLQYLTVAMFTVFKNITIVFIALGERHLFRSEISPLTWLSFALIVRMRAVLVRGYGVDSQLVDWRSQRPHL